MSITFSITLWRAVWEVLRQLRPAFSRLQTFLWFATAVAGFCTRGDLSAIAAIAAVSGLGSVLLGKQ